MHTRKNVLFTFKYSISIFSLRKTDLSNLKHYDVLHKMNFKIHNSLN